MAKRRSRGKYNVGGKREDPYENLANAIIKQACDDYEKALKKPDRPTNKKTIKEIERFVQTQRYESFTSVDGKWLLSKLRQKVEKEREESE